MGGFLRKTFGQLRQGEGPAAAAVAPVVQSTIATATAGAGAGVKPSITAAVKKPTLIAGRPDVHTSPQGVVDEELKLKKRKLGAGKAKA
jgi:hypothetical protein